MAYSNFKPTVWSAHIQHELPKYTVFEQGCDYQFKGDAEKGKTVKILGVSRPTIGDYKGTDIGAPEVVADSSQLLLIDQAKYFNFLVDDVDEVQSKEGLMKALSEEATRAMAQTRDTYIASLVKDSTQMSTTKITSKATAKSEIDKALTTLWNNGITLKDKVTIYLSPAVYMYMKEYLDEIKTDNNKQVESGVLGRYAGAVIKMSNNFYNDGTDDYLFVSTPKAIAFCGGINSVEAYRPEGLFADAVKGLNTFGGKIVRPKELYVIKAANAKSGTQASGQGSGGSGTNPVG